MTVITPLTKPAIPVGQVQLFRQNSPAILSVSFAHGSQIKFLMQVQRLCRDLQVKFHVKLHISFFFYRELIIFPSQINCKLPVTVDHHGILADSESSRSLLPDLWYTIHVRILEKSLQYEAEKKITTYVPSLKSFTTGTNIHNP